MFALIRQKTPNAMQSGRKGSWDWEIGFPEPAHRRVDPLTGSTMSSDPLQQLDLIFSTKEEAIAYAKRKGIAYQVIEAPRPKRISRSYADNFAYDRKFPWTH